MMKGMPRVWWDGTDFIYLMPGPLLGQEGWEEQRKPGLYRAQTVQDLPKDVVELVQVPSNTVVGMLWASMRRSPEMEMCIRAYWPGLGAELDKIADSWETQR